MKDKENIKQFQGKIPEKFLKQIFRDPGYQDQKMSMMTEVITNHKPIVNNLEYLNLS